MIRALRSLLSTSCLTAALLAGYSLPVQANPQGGTVSAGQASITQSGKTLDITQQSNMAVIDWRGFDIAADETTQFMQPSSSSIALNRVNSTSASQINGTLSANGNIVILNQNGVMFGQGAKVDVNGLIATTAGISNDAFMNSGGKMNFTIPGNPTASIVNEGQITAGQAGLIGLVAPSVINSGIITAKLGRVQLASGDTATVDLYGDGLMEVAVSDQVKSQLVSNTGTIAADGGSIALTAAAGSQIVDSLTTNSGTLQAQSVGQSNGLIVISAEGSNAVPNNIAANKGQKSGSSTVEVSGPLDASGYNPGETGGAVEVLGDHIALLSGSLIDASGDAGGGTIRVGGDFHGAGSTPTASFTIMQTGASLLANAITTGNGGNITLWSDGETDFGGTIQAKGGSQSGNGGYVETSGHNLMAVGMVNAGAPNGNAGTWLLDPNNIVISQASCTGTGCASASSIATSLGTSNVTVTTTDGSITLSGNISAAAPSGGDTLTFSAGTDIVISSSNSVTGTGSNKLNVIFDADTAAGGGAIVMNSGSSITSNGGNITMGGQGSPTTLAAVGDAANGNGITLSGASLLSENGSILLRGQGFANTSASGLEGVSIFGGSVVESTGGAITINGVGGNGAYGNAGMNAYGSGTTISSNQGSIDLIGVGNGVSGYEFGIAMYGGAVIQSTGSGSNAAPITIRGTGGDEAYDDNYGILLQGDPGTKVTTIDGNVQITGVGVGPSNSFGINSELPIQSSGKGAITLTGTGSGGADINLTSQLGGASANGVIILNADTISAVGGTIQTTNSVIFQPRTASTPIGVAGGSGTLQITSGAGSILANTTAGSIVIGNTSDTGAMTVDANTWSEPLSLVSGSGPITIAGAQAMGSHNFTLQTDATPTLSSTVTTSGNALLEPASVGTTITVAGSGSTLNITSGILGDITAGSLTIGNSSDMAAMTVDAYSWGEPLTLLSGSGNITIAGIQTLGTKTLTADTSSGNIVIDQGDKIVSTAPFGNSIVLAAGGNFINNDSSDGASALSPGSSPARYLVYSTNPSQNTMGGLSDASDHIFNKTYSGYAPGSVTQTGNLFLYALAPTITVTANNTSRLYGAGDPTFTASYSGFVDSDTSAIFTGSPSLTTPVGDTATSAAGSTYTITAAVGSLAQSLGYQLNFAPGTLTVNANTIPTSVISALQNPVINVASNISAVGYADSSSGGFIQVNDNMAGSDTNASVPSQPDNDNTHSAQTDSVFHSPANTNKRHDDLLTINPALARDLHL